VACALALGTTTKLGIRKRALAAKTIWLALRKQKSTITSPEEFFIISKLFNSNAPAVFRLAEG
jgi:hypothetical protein